MGLAAPQTNLKPIGSVAGQDRLMIRLAAVDANPFVSAMSLVGFAQETLG